MITLEAPTWFEPANALVRNSNIRPSVLRCQKRSARTKRCCPIILPSNRFPPSTQTRSAPDSWVRNMPPPPSFHPAALSAPRNSPQLKVENLEPPQGLSDAQVDKRRQMWRMLQNEFLDNHPDASPLAHDTMYQRAFRMMDAGATEAFDLSQEPSRTARGIRPRSLRTKLPGCSSFGRTGRSTGRSHAGWRWTRMGHAPGQLQRG